MQHTVYWVQYSGHTAL